MKQISKPGIMALIISLVFIACNSEENKTDATTDTTTMTDATSQNQDMDAVKVAPGLYTMVKDSMGIRVLEVLYKPGDSSAIHSHPDNALYVIDGGKGEFTGKDGSKQVADFKPGMTMIRGSEAHSVKNTGTTTLKAILVEVNRPNQAANSHDISLDATKTASKFYKAVHDSLNMRIVMVDYKPGEVSALHSHPDLAMYTLSPAKAEFTAKDGTKQVMTMDKGMAVIVPSGAHSVKNVGNTNAKVVLIEVNRPSQ
ncbi:MAG TPA: cupin domain-containing protein [Chitinophagaceae bacterium]|nr:cupin domain-containing protein [Chitinophagaceae bacterium]